VSSIVKYLPPIDELKSILNKNPELIKYYEKSEGFIGDCESVKYIQSFIKNSNKIV
jgi:hypothetical protein